MGPISYECNITLGYIRLLGTCTPAYSAHSQVTKKIKCCQYDSSLFVKPPPPYPNNNPKKFASDFVKTNPGTTSSKTLLCVNYNREKSPLPNIFRERQEPNLSPHLRYLWYFYCRLLHSKLACCFLQAFLSLMVRIGPTLIGIEGCATWVSFCIPHKFKTLDKNDCQTY